MTLAIDAATSRVATTAARAFGRLSDTVVEASLASLSGITGAPGRTVIAADLGKVDCVLDEQTDPAELAPAVDRLSATGWEVTVLVPAARMGEAHRALRGVRTRIQPWWVDPADVLCFGATEVP